MCAVCCSIRFCPTEYCTPYAFHLVKGYFDRPSRPCALGFQPTYTCLFGTDNRLRYYTQTESYLGLWLHQLNSLRSSIPLRGIISHYLLANASMFQALPLLLSSILVGMNLYESHLVWITPFEAGLWRKPLSLHCCNVLRHNALFSISKTYYTLILPFCQHVF